MSKAKASKSKPGTAVAKRGADTGAVAAPPSNRTDLPPGITIKRQVTMPSLVMKTPGEVRYLAIRDAMRVSNIKDKPDAHGKTRDPATVCTVVDIQTGENFTWLVPAVCKGNFNEVYPGDSYVGLAFRVENRGKREGKRYTDFSLDEIALSPA